MTIREIKAQLSLLKVLQHYNLRPNSNGMLCCPFHQDKKASMKIYEETNTAYCFAGTCEVNNVDVIDFIMQMESCSKHEAILKAKSLIHPIATNPKKEMSMNPKQNPKQNPSKDFARYQTSLINNWEAQKYCERRGLDPKELELGYKSRSTKTKWGRGCIIFPLKNDAGEVVSLYGRSVFNIGHYYQEGRSGLYPGYPGLKTKRLIICESVIDAASIKQLDLGYEVLALYGVNGLTSEHVSAVAKLTELEEIVLILDGDEAGRGATEFMGKQFIQLRPEVQVSRVDLAEGEDVNSLVAGHEKAKDLFKELLAGRVLMNEPVVRAPEVKPVLNVSDPNNLIYITRLANYFIKGGIRYGASDFDHMKITLVIESEARRKSRQKVDLYDDKQVEKVSRLAGEKLGLRSDLIEDDLQALIDELENYRERLQAPKVEKQKIEIPVAMKERCEEFLKKPKLLSRINELIGRAGIVGEENNRLLLFVIASSYKMRATLHALVQGSSGSGKTKLLKVISELMPEEEVKKYTRVTDGSFYNQGEYFFKNKLVCFEDIDGLKEDALLAVRELQSNEILITSTSIKDESGKISGGERIVRGPIASISCTTKAEVYEDNISRCFVIAVDESKEQSLRIIKYQNEKAAGIIDRKKEEELKEFVQNCIRILEPLEVINPYANKIHLPQDAHKIRRLNELYQSFVRQVTLLNQYQRKRDKQGRLITEKEDLQVACDILFESIVLKVDELDGSLRQFFEKLKKYVKSKGENYEFSQREVRLHFRISKTGMQRYINTLLELEYLMQQGHPNRGYRYKISYWDDNAGLRERIKRSLKEQLKAL